METHSAFLFCPRQRGGTSHASTETFLSQPRTPQVGAFPAAGWENQFLPCTICPGRGSASSGLSVSTTKGKAQGTAAAGAVGRKPAPPQLGGNELRVHWQAPRTPAELTALRSPTPAWASSSLTEPLPSALAWACWELQAPRELPLPGCRAAAPGAAMTVPVCSAGQGWACWPRAAGAPSLSLPEERVAVWDAVAVYVQQQLLLRKGVRIPTFGSFSVVAERIEAEDGTMIVQWPAFCLARSLADIRNLTDNKEYLPGHKEVEPLKFSEVAAAASVTWQTGKACVFGTTSLISHCLKKGENIAFVLKDIGVLVIEGTRVQMKFYYDFLERISGKENLEKVVFKVPWLLDTVVSRVAPVASLTSSGRVIVFPKFRREFVPKPPPGKPRKASEVPLPPPGRGKKEEFPPLPPWIRVTFLVDTRSEKRTSDDKKKSSQLPAVPGVSSAKKQPGKQKKGKCSTRSKATEMGPAQAAAPPSGKEEEHGVVKAPARGGVPEKAQAKLRNRCGAPALQQTPMAALWSSSSLTSLPEEPTYNASALVPLARKGIGPMQSQPPKAKAGLPWWGMSRPC